MHTPELSRLSLRWLGKAWEQASEAERHVLTQLQQRQRSSRAPADLADDRSLGERVADGVARFGGSWGFIGSFAAFLALWVLVNLWWLRSQAFDPYPFIFLNLLLSMLAALQAPVIMMSQNRQAARDRDAAEHDYRINLKAELEIMALHDKLDQLRVEQLERIPKLSPLFPRFESAAAATIGAAAIPDRDVARCIDDDGAFAPSAGRPPRQPS